MAALMSLYIGSLHTQTGTWTSTLTTQCMWRGDWSSACLREQGTSLPPRGASKKNKNMLWRSWNRMDIPIPLSTLHHKRCEVKREIRRTLLVVLPHIHVAEVSENIRRVCSRFGIRAVFKSGQTLKLMLTKMKDTLPLGKWSIVTCIHQILCSCG